MNRSKYGAKSCTIDGIRFDSKLEAHRYQHLRMMQTAGMIRDLERQVRFPLAVADKTLGHYIADFVYFDKDKNCRVIEDAKGVLTPLCKWKLAHMAALGNHVTLWPERKKKGKK